MSTPLATVLKNAKPHGAAFALKAADAARQVIKASPVSESSRPLHWCLTCEGPCRPDQLYCDWCFSRRPSR